MSWSARFVAMIVAVVGLAMAASALADANQHFSAKVRVLANSDQFEYHGRVKSNLTECEVNRKVIIKRGSTKIAKAFTDESGRFSVKDDPVPDGSVVKFKLVANEPNCRPLKLEVEI